MKTYKYLVSVRLMTYMHEQFITQAMDSIMMQKTNFNVEVVIGDDFSTDKTLEILKSYKKKKNIDIKILKREKGDEYWQKRQKLGRFYNYINILENCSGKYIAILDGDDYWTDSLKLQKQVNLIEEHKQASMCVALNKQFFPDENKYIEDKMYNGKNKSFVYLEDLHKHYFHTSTYLIRKSSLDFVLKNYVHLIKGDTALRYLLISQGPHIVLNEYVSVYRISGKGIWTNLPSIKKDILNYRMHHNFRKYFMLEQKKVHLNLELIFLKRIYIHYSKQNKFCEALKWKMKYIYFLFFFFPRKAKTKLNKKFKYILSE